VYKPAGECLVHVSYDWFQTGGGDKDLVFRWLPSGQQVVPSERQGDCQGSLMPDPGGCIGALPEPPVGVTALEVEGIACGGTLNDERALEIVSVAACAPECEYLDPSCRPIYDHPCYEPNTGASSSGPVAEPGIYLPFGNARYTDVDGLPSSLPFLAKRTADSKNDEVGVFGRGWFSVFDAMVEDVFPDLTANKYYRVATEDNLSVYFRETNSPGVFVQAWPTNGPIGSLAQQNNLFTYTEPDGNIIRVFDLSNDGRLAAITDVRTGKTVDLTYAAGFPESVSDTDGNWSWDITEGPTGRIASIVAGDITLQYLYSTGSTGHVLDEVRVEGAVWRSYEYDSGDRLTGVEDGVGRLIAEATYWGPGETYEGWVQSSTNRDAKIINIAYHVARDDVNAAAGEYVVEVTNGNGVSTDYYIRPVHGGPDKVTMVRGDCSGCGDGEFAALAYGPDGRLVRKQDALGAVTEWTYDYMGRVSQVTTGNTLDPSDCDPNVQSYCYATTADALMGAVLVSDGATSTSYTYSDNTWKYRPTSVCRSSVVEQGETGCISYVYDAETGVATSTTVSGWTVDVTQNPVHEDRPSTVTLYSGQNAVFSPVAEAAAVDVFDLAFLEAWLSHPQPIGLPMRTDGPLQEPELDITLFVYYPIHDNVPPVLRGRLAAEKSPTGEVSFFDAYDVSGRVLRAIDPRGVKTEYSYDALGRVLTETVLPNCNSDFGFNLDSLCSEALVTSYEYESTTGPLSTVTRPSGLSVTLHSYDEWGRLTWIGRGPSILDIKELIVRSYDPDQWGQVESELLKQVIGNFELTRRRTDYEHDGFGRLHRTAYPRYLGDPSAPFDEYSYDAAGNVLTFKDGNHDSETPNVEYEYDVRGRLTTVRSMVDASTWSETGYEYDANGNLQVVIDANDLRTEYLIDDFGQTYRIDSPATGTTLLGYDLAGRLATREDARGMDELRTYDASGRLTLAELDIEGGVHEETTFGYQKGYPTLASATYPGANTVTQTQVFDRRGLTLHSVQTQDDTETVSFSYDRDGNLLSRTRGACEKVEHLVDWAGRPTRVTVRPSGCSASKKVADNVSYLPFGPPAIVQRMQGLQYSLGEELQYDLQYRLILQAFKRYGAGAVTLLERRYGTPEAYDGYDGAGNLLTVTDVFMPARSRTFGYDDMGRLVSAVTPGALGAIEYDYDLVGNRTRREYGPVGKRSYENLHYDAGTGLLVSIEEVPWGGVPQFHDVIHDEVGNLELEIGEPNQTYTYSPRNQLVSHNTGLQYSYDAYGRRVRSKRPVGGQQRIVRHYLLPDGRPHLDKPSALMQPAPVPWSYAYLGDRLLARFDGAGNVEHVVTDHIGYPMATISYTGTIQWQPDPEPFGDVISEQQVGPGHDPLIRYPGQWRVDPVLSTTEPAFTTLYYNTHRWYNPTWGRYTQADPLGGDSLLKSIVVPENLFGYAEADPLRLIDPFGLCSCDDDCPSGNWSYHAVGGSIALVIGGSISRGTFTCQENGFKFPVKAICFQAGIIGAAGVGYERDLGRQIDFRACNGEDYLGGTHGVTGALGPWSATGSEFGTTGGLFRSTGFGGAYVYCYTTRRTGWFFNPFGG
jgi:RHS repeat-associated protein